MIDEDVKKVIDTTLEAFQQYMDGAMNYTCSVLEKNNIPLEPDVVFSFNRGYIDGSAMTAFFMKHKRSMNPDEIEELHQFLYKKGNEIREAITKYLR